MNTITHNEARYPAWIETSRLLLRPPRLEDAIELSALAESDSSFARNTVGNEANTLEGACTAVVRMLEDRRLGLGSWWVALEKTTGRMAGIAGYSERNASHGLVYALAADYAGKGFAYEAVEALSASGSHRRLASDPQPERREETTEIREANARWYWHSKRSGDGRTGRFARCA